MALRGGRESSMACGIRSAFIHHAAAAWELAFAGVKSGLLTGERKAAGDENGGKTI